MTAPPIKSGMLKFESDCWEIIPADAAGVVDGAAASAVLPKSKTALVAFSCAAKESWTTSPADRTTLLEKSTMELTTPLASPATSGEKEIFCCALSCRTTAPLSAPTLASVVADEVCCVDELLDSFEGID